MKNILNAVSAEMSSAIQKKDIPTVFQLLNNIVNTFIITQSEIFVRPLILSIDRGNYYLAKKIIHGVNMGADVLGADPLTAMIERYQQFDQDDTPKGQNMLERTVCFFKGLLEERLLNIEDKLYLFKDIVDQRVVNKAIEVMTHDRQLQLQDAVNQMNEDRVETLLKDKCWYPATMIACLHDSLMLGFFLITRKLLEASDDTVLAVIQSEKVVTTEELVKSIHLSQDEDFESDDVLAIFQTLKQHDALNLDEVGLEEVLLRLEDAEGQKDFLEQCYQGGLSHTL